MAAAPISFAAAQARRAAAPAPPPATFTTVDEAQHFARAVEWMSAGEVRDAITRLDEEIAWLGRLRALAVAALTRKEAEAAARLAGPCPDGGR